jgi:hypothetical protein
MCGIVVPSPVFRVEEPCPCFQTSRKYVLKWPLNLICGYGGPDCMNLVPEQCMNFVQVLLICQSTNDTTLTMHPHTNIDYFERIGQGNGLHIRHLLQLPVKLALSARHIRRQRCRLY